MSSRLPTRAPMPPQSLYERLKTLQPAELQEELEAAEAYWEGDAEELQVEGVGCAAGMVLTPRARVAKCPWLPAKQHGRVLQLAGLEGMPGHDGLRARRSYPPQERRMELRRRQQDEQMLERIKRRVAGDKVEVPRGLVRLVTGRQGGTDSGRSRLSTPAGGSARRLLGGGEASQGSQAGALAAAEEQAEAQPRCFSWWPRVQLAAQRLSTHPDFQVAVFLVILFNCIGTPMGHRLHPAS